MKKVILFAAASLFVLASCKKEYTCACTTTDEDGEVFASAETKFEAKKKDAETVCGGNEASAGGLTTKCELK